MTTTYQNHKDRLVAEKALGKPLPEGAQVHHFTQEQLVICQDDIYHKLLHVRARALKACGNAKWRKCKICKQYDAPENLYINPKHGHIFHNTCVNEHYRKQKKNKE